MTAAEAAAYLAEWLEGSGRDAQVIGTHPSNLGFTIHGGSNPC